MGLRSLLPRSVASDKRTLYILLTAPVLSILAARLLARLLATATYNGVPPGLRIYKAPLPDAPASEGSGVDDDDQGAIYPPHALPGARNVATPHGGTTRAYEWGPERGRKVLLIHGISTPCVALARLARRLARDGGCRVMLYDLPGRGYSDAADPGVHRQDMGLFGAQLLAVLATSELDWTGRGGGFTLIGYSLGGGIAAAFTACFLGMVDGLVLMAPGGLLRPSKVSIASRLLYGGFLPDAVVHFWIRSILRAGTTRKAEVESDFAAARRKTGKIDLTYAAAEELPHHDAASSAHAQDSRHPIFEDRPSISSATVVARQVERHPGFVPAFASCVRYAPIHDGFERWRLIGERCEAMRDEARRGVGAGARRIGLKEGRVLVILGLRDVVISSEEIAEDAAAALGAENVRVVKVDGSHDFPITNSEACAETIIAFWDGRI